MTTLRDFLSKYDPRQPRDNSGRWTSVGGGAFAQVRMAGKGKGGKGSSASRGFNLVRGKETMQRYDNVITEMSLTADGSVRYRGTNYMVGGLATGSVRSLSITDRWYNAEPLTGKKGFVSLAIPFDRKKHKIAWKHGDGSYYKLEAGTSKAGEVPFSRSEVQDHFIFSAEGLIGVPKGTSLHFDKGQPPARTAESREEAQFSASVARQVQIAESWEEAANNQLAELAGISTTTTPRRRRLARRPSASPRSSSNWKQDKLVEGLRVRLANRVDEKTFESIGERDAAEVVGRILAGAKVHGLSVDVDSARNGYGALSFSAQLTDKNGDKAGSISRSFYPSVGKGDVGYVDHSYFRLETKYQGMGIAKDIFRTAIPQYQRLGFTEVRVGAGLDQGGYAWAKYGFVPTQDTWRYTLESARSRAKSPEAKKFLKTLKASRPKDLWKLADSVIGHDMLAGSGWDGVLKFSDREAMARFNAYVGANVTKPTKAKPKKRVAKASTGVFVMAELLDPETPTPLLTLMEHRAELKARGLDEATIEAMYPIMPLSKSLRSKADKLA